MMALGPALLETRESRVRPNRPPSMSAQHRLGKLLPAACALSDSPWAMASCDCPANHACQTGATGW